MYQNYALVSYKWDVRLTYVYKMGGGGGNHLLACSVLVKCIFTEQKQPLYLYHLVLNGQLFWGEWGRITAAFSRAMTSRSVIDLLRVCCLGMPSGICLQCSMLNITNRGLHGCQGLPVWSSDFFIKLLYRKTKQKNSQSASCHTYVCRTHIYQ